MTLSHQTGIARRSLWTKRKGARISRRNLDTLERFGVTCKAKKCRHKKITWAYCAPCAEANKNAKRIK